VATSADSDAVTSLRIIHEDERLVVVDKPAGVATAPGGGIGAGESMQEQVATHLGTRAFIVHRLDRETSGVVLFAKTAESHRLLSQQFEDRTVAKRYLALVQGQVRVRSGSITEPLREFASGRIGVDPAGKEATTMWALRERLVDADLLEVTPITGRRHQIRVHLYSIGHPILGDTRYGDDRPVGGAPRLMLHALELVLADGLSIRAEPPADFIEAAASRQGEAISARAANPPRSPAPRPARGRRPAVRP
jgi:tRNA pseudouridine32 synthase/23S rRNA pseudouridine746 synthase